VATEATLKAIMTNVKAGEGVGRHAVTATAAMTTEKHNSMRQPIVPLDDQVIWKNKMC